LQGASSSMSEEGVSVDVRGRLGHEPRVTV